MQSIAGFFRKVISADPNEVSNEQTSEVGENSPKNDTERKGEHSSPTFQQEIVQNEDYTILKDTIYDLIKDIRDPEKPETLEELNVVSEDSVSIHQFNSDDILVKIVFVPTVPHCSLASLIGLCMRQKLVQNLPDKHKLDIFIKEGTHETAEEINKQINDKERIAAAMENPNLRDLVNKCIDEEESYR